MDKPSWLQLLLLQWPRSADAQRAMIPDERIAHAIKSTEVLRLPRQTLATFGTTILKYYVVTEPAYAGVVESSEDSVVREGTVTAQRPQVVTPYYVSNLEGFSTEAKRYFQMEAERYGTSLPGLMYGYRNEPGGTTITSGNLHKVANNIIGDLDHRGVNLAAVIRGVDDLWDVSLLKFIYELTARSVATNVQEMQSHGLLDMDSSGIPRDARDRIDAMFKEARRGNLDPAVLKRELDQWDVFPEYEDRFLGLFRRR